MFQFQSDTTILIAMKYYSLGSLRSCAEYDGCFLTTAFGQVLDGLVYFHEEVKVAHRDIKPANNILVLREPHRKFVIADFGLAAVVPSGEKSWLHTFDGTVAFIAPEVFSGNDLGHRCVAGLWSLGVTVTEWMIGPPIQPLKPEGPYIASSA